MTFSLEAELVRRGIAVSGDALDKFERYYRLLVEWNERMNLTAITDYDEVMEKHFFDSITPAFYQDFSGITKLADIGAGAGFPSLPLKILFPHLEVTIIDSLKKRILFLQELVNHLKLDGVQCIHARAEEAGRDPSLRDRFPFVIARAVARMPALVELCMPFVRVGGTFLALKGSGGIGELQEASLAIQVLGGKWVRTETLFLPRESAQRTLIWIAKVKSTPKAYPRRPGLPARQPIR